MKITDDKIQADDTVMCVAHLGTEHDMKCLEKDKVEVGKIYHSAEVHENYDYVFVKGMFYWHPTKCFKKIQL